MSAPAPAPWITQEPEPFGSGSTVLLNVILFKSLFQVVANGGSDESKNGGGGGADNDDTAEKGGEERELEPEPEKKRKKESPKKSVKNEVLHIVRSEASI